MKAKLLGLSILGLGLVAVVYLAARPKEAPAPAAPIVSSSEQAGSPEPARSPEPAGLPEPARSVTAPAPKPVNSTTVPVSKANDEPRSAAAKPQVAPDPRPEPPVLIEPVTPPAAVTAAPEPQKPRFEEVTVTADSVLGVTLDSTVSSETSRIEDRVNARVSRDVVVDGKVAVASGARLEGVVTEVTRGGKFRERARVGVTFQTLILADGTKIALSTDPVFREGDPPDNVNAKVGGSGVVGAILGAMIGGKKGAVLGGAAGAAGGAAVVAAGNRADVVLISGSSLTVRLKQPITVLVERH